ncbi:spermine/spermidine synthase domain-containing protein [Pararhodobacter aggregans]
MTLWTELARASTEAGDDIILRHRDDIYEIRFNGIELMSNIMWRSEAVLSERSLRRLEDMRHPRVLIGGLGMGFTLRAALDLTGPGAQVTVCELIPAIADWNRGILAPLADHPLSDPRVDLRVMDVMDLLNNSEAGFDVVLMDTDNGPDFLVRGDNQRLYERNGLNAVRDALRPGGIAAFWSAEISDPFEDRLSEQGWDWQREDIQLPGGRVDAFHHIYLARQAAVAPASARLAVAGRP